MTVELSGYGKYLGTEKFDFTIKKGKGKNYIKPFHSIDEIRLSSGNSVSTKALAWACARARGYETLISLY
jgi:CRISPR/Cas system-associated endonuclease Cas1